MKIAGWRTFAQERQQQKQREQKIQDQRTKYLAEAYVKNQDARYYQIHNNVVYQGSGDLIDQIANNFEYLKNKQNKFTKWSNDRSKICYDGNPVGVVKHKDLARTIAECLNDKRYTI